MLFTTLDPTSRATLTAGDLEQRFIGRRPLGRLRADGLVGQAGKAGQHG